MNYVPDTPNVYKNSGGGVFYGSYVPSKTPPPEFL